MDPDLKEVRNEVRMLAIFTAQALAVLAAEDRVVRDSLDQTVTRYQGVAESPGAKIIMEVIRDSFDKMQASMRRAFPDEDRMG